MFQFDLKSTNQSNVVVTLQTLTCYLISILLISDSLEYIIISLYIDDYELFQIAEVRFHLSDVCKDGKVFDILEHPHT